MKSLLARPELYQLYQVAGGFFGARLKAFRDYVDFAGISRIFDIGCGPGHIVQHIPQGIDYVGFDTEARYIDFANRVFGDKGRFVTRPFDESAARDFGRPDMILMNGVLHHMDDGTARLVLAAAARVLGDSGSLFALDGAYEDNQNPISHYLIKNDRGAFVRTAPAYRALVAESFTETESHVRNDLSWVPYTFAITIGRRGKRPA